MRALVIDTAGPVVGVAAFQGGACVGTREIRVERGADGWLGPAVEALLRELGGLDAVAVSVGPGTFTGLRVGVATALGLALSRGVGVWCLSSLALRACLAPGEPRVLSLLDARKGRIYTGLFDRTAGCAALGPEGDLLPADAAATAPCVVVGEGVRACEAELAAAGHRVHPAALQSPVSAAGPLLGGALLAPEHVALRYLREPDARPRAALVAAG